VNLSLNVHLSTRKQPYGPSNRTTLEARTQPATICRWIYSRLEGRNIIITLSGEIPRQSMGKDCPQKCVTSHLLWSLAVDKLLWGLNRGNYYTVRYADILKSKLT
jgi:hypothetical protein